MLEWDIYEVRPGRTPIVGVNFRNTVKKFSLAKEIDLLIDNSQDRECVRFAVISDTDVSSVKEFIVEKFPGATIEKVKGHIKNPVLSAMYCN
ncbi:MAG: hypothetical protein OXR66_03485 [Candidatus Woesearchaeota archaeon]|nr:hypothetical protein [Candidatus Woesearchaeota archaeon]